MKWNQLLSTAKQISIPIVLAAAVEIPRWAVAFQAIREPAILSVPLAAMITWSMSVAWERVFNKRGNYRTMFALASITLLLAVIVITPVIYFLMESKDFSVSLATLPPTFRLVWSVALALLTFLPLIILAAAQEPERHALERKHEERKTTRSSESETVKPADNPATETAKPPRAPRQNKELSTPDDDRKRAVWQMAQNGVTQEEIAAQYGVSTRTIRN